MVIKLQETEIKFVKMPHYVEHKSNLSYETSGSVCFDICAAISEPVILKAGKRAIIPTGIKFIPENPIWYRLNSRSGLSAREGVITIGGIFDTDYRGEILVILLNTNDDDSQYVINPGDRITQAELPFPYKAKFVEITEEEFAKDTTDRGAGGFGSTGR